MSELNDPLSALDEAIEKARGMIPGGSKRMFRRMVDRVNTSHRKLRGDAKAGRANNIRREQRAASYLQFNRGARVHKSIDALDAEIEKALRINGGMKISPKQRRTLAMDRGTNKNSRTGFSQTRGPHFGSGRRGKPSGGSIYSGARGLRATYLNARRSAKEDGSVGRSWLKDTKTRVAGAIHRYRTSRGEPSPYKRKLFGGGLKRIKKTATDIHKAKPKTLYVYRPVENAEDILAWAKGQWFKSTLPADKIHVTIIASATELNWATLFDDYHIEPAEERKSMCDCGPVYRLEDRTKTKTIEGGVREVKQLGDKGAVALCFESLSLTSRWLDLRRAGAVSKFSSFQPHITLTLSGDVPKDVQPYNGPIVLGEECWEEYKDGAYANVEENVTKAALDALSARLDEVEKAQAKPAEAA